MDPDMIPYILTIGIPCIILWLTDCLIKKRIAQIVIYFVVLILFWIFFSVGLYIDLRNGVGMYYVSDWDNFPYWNVFVFTFGCSFFFTFLFVVVPNLILNEKD